MADFKELEERILAFWEDNNVFQKSMKQREGRSPFVFYEGPPTANGSPGIHHVIARVFKDIMSRFKTMRGFYVLRKSGWDTHGLPVEIQVEKELGFKSKKDIEAYGIAAFNAKCRQSVWKFKEEWERFTRRIGYWVDLEHPYITYENSYMESLWNVIGRIWDKKLLYQAHRVVPFCTRCGTPLSNHEVALGYKKVTDSSVYLKFKVKSSKLKLPKNTSILAWTTTPWTLPGNVALAVGADINYILGQKGDEYFIVAEELAKKVLGDVTVVRTFLGSELVGILYTPLFAVKALKKLGSYQVYAADFVTTTDGTGIVHTAVMYGDDDYQLGTKLKLVKHHTVTEQGLFVGVSKELDGRYVKDAEVEHDIFAHLTSKDFLLQTAPYEHEYPFCWRCDTPLLYYAKDSWFVRMSSVNKELIANNETINWVPEHLKHGRFGQWIAEGRDWTFSRERYWGTPLPVWSARDKAGRLVGEPLVISSLADLDTYRVRKPNTYWAIRHGESDHNVNGVIDSGSGGSLLTDQGREAVAFAGEKLKKMLGRNKPVVMLTSPLRRAHQTAVIIGRVLGISPKTEKRLEEIQLGPSLEGRPLSQYHATYPTYPDKFAQRPPGGESLVDLRTRMFNLTRELDAKYEGKNIVLVSHGDPIWMMTAAAEGWSQEESIVKKVENDNEYIDLAGIEKIVVKNLPRDETGMADLHRPYVDDLALKRPGSRTLLYRVPDVCDVWFDSGSMPYAQWHMPFENADMFRQQFPADFITEGIDQTRGWFYTLLAVSTLLGDGAPYKNVLSLGHILDEKGQKMSKSKGNVVKPDEVFEQVGVDAARWYFYVVNNPGDTKLFSLREVKERLTGFLGTLENCVRFYELYEQEAADWTLESGNLLDQWILSRLAGVVGTATESLERFDPTGAARAIESFVVDDFSQWWLRRSRKRTDARGLLRHLLRQIALLCAPFVPFMAEDIWQRLKVPTDHDSVHLGDWPKVSKEHLKPELEEAMVRVRTAISAGLAVRKQEQIKVRQPLAVATIPGAKLADDLETLTRDELNVKKVNYGGEAVTLDLIITPALRAEGWAREVSRSIQEMRKEAGLNVGDTVHAQWWSDDAEVSAAIAEHLPNLIQQRDTKSLDLERTFDLASGKSIWLGIKK